MKGFRSKTWKEGEKGGGFFVACPPKFFDYFFNLAG